MMAFKMRLYHRRSSASREKLLLTSHLTTDSLHKLQIMGAHGPRGSVSSLSTAPKPRQRSLSLYPGMERANCLQLPPRSRSNSFSAVPSRHFTVSEGHCTLTSSEEDYVFKCYTRAMYVILGMTGATVLLFFFYSIYQLSHI